MRSILILAFVVFAAPAYATDNSAPANAPVVRSELAPAEVTEPVKVSPEMMRLNAEMGVTQGHMNALLTQRGALDVQIKALQQKIDDAGAMRDKMSK